GLVHVHYISFVLTRLAPRSTLFPYTTLFRSVDEAEDRRAAEQGQGALVRRQVEAVARDDQHQHRQGHDQVVGFERPEPVVKRLVDRKSTRLNSSHSQISYAVFCLKKKIEHS